MTFGESRKKVTPPDWYDELLCVKELADRIKRTPRYVYAMKRDGFAMPGGLATVRQALDWLTDNPRFRVNAPRSAERGS